MSTANLSTDTDQVQFDMAKQLASMAEELDYAKNSFEPLFRNASIGLVREMHKLAEALAGDRAGEIYVPSDEAA